MKKISTIVLGDLRLIFRDRMLSIFVFAPIILILFVRLFVPYVVSVYPVVKDFQIYIMMFASLQTAILYGFITSFMILEEKDEHVTEVIRILPVSSALFIICRLLFATFISGLGSFLMILFGGFDSPGLLNALLLSLQYGLAAPLIALIAGTFAANKIEGMAIFKGLNLLLILPVLSFFINGIFKYVFAFVPVYWTYLLYKTALAREHTVLVFLAGMVIYLLFLFLMFRQFKKRVLLR